MPTQNKKSLTKADVKEVQKAYQTSVEEFLAPKKMLANVIGMGVGVKWKKGKPTGEPALVVLVTQKIGKEHINSSNMIPSKLSDMQTDVLSIGHPFAGARAPSEAGSLNLTERVRPAKGGYSVGHTKIGAGTIATCVYDILPGGKTSPPIHGIGIPPKYYILSNNHVLANCNDASPGDQILQPGPLDGGANLTDCIAYLSRFIPLNFEPTVPRTNHNNIVDAAIAEVAFKDTSREIYWSGYVKGWRLKANISVGTDVQKTGRSTNYTTGRITAINATVDIGYSNGRVARFKDQIMTTILSAAGDSGSLVTTLDDIAVGLLFAGSSNASILNQIENVRSLLRIEVAGRIL